MKPRLLIITNRLIVGGISNDIIPLAYYLQQEFDIKILYGEKEKSEIEADFLVSNYPGLDLKKIKSFKKGVHFFDDISAYNEIKKEIKNFKADIVHTHGVKSGLLGRRAAHALSIKYIVHTFHGHHFHSYYNNLTNAFLLRLERTLGRITTQVIAVSKWQKKELTEIYKIVQAEKVKTISLGIETKNNSADALELRSAFRKKYNIKDNVIAIGVAGRLVPIKNLKLFIQSAQVLKTATVKKICFFIIGDGILKKQLQQQCAALNIDFTETAGKQATVIFTSWIEDIMPAMRAMDIVALTSNNEGTPMSLIEAQFCGKPVVATDAGGVKDTILNNETGFLVEKENAAAIVNKLKLLVENDELRKTMGIKASAFIKENFSKQTEVEHYKNLYKQLLSVKNVEYSVQEHTSIQ